MEVNKKIVCLMLFLFALVFVLPAKEAHAYLDPGSGSYMLQLIVAGLAGFIISLKMFWRQISAFITNLFSKTKANQPIKNKNDNE